MGGENKITLNEVAGLKEEKEELQEIVEFLREPGKFTKVGARIPASSRYRIDLIYKNNTWRMTLRLREHTAFSSLS